MTDFDRGFRAGVEAAANAAQEVKNEPYSEVDLDDETLHWRRGMARGAHRAEVAIRALQPPQQPDAAPSAHFCACGAPMNEGEAKCFACCDACWDKHYAKPENAAPRCPTCSGSGEIWNGVTHPEPCDDPRHFEFTRPLAPASPALAAWRALTTEDRRRVFGLLDNDITGEAAVARDLLCSLAPEAGDANEERHE